MPFGDGIDITKIVSLPITNTVSDAYLGPTGTGSVNSDNYLDLDEDGNTKDNNNDGEGVNSDSFT